MIKIARITVFTLLYLLAAPAFAQENKPVSGPAEIIDGKTLKVAGRTLILADIIIPLPGTTCLWNDKLRDCGLVSKTSLQDITVASTITCTLVDADAYRCITDEDFDIAFGQIHAGWAVPEANAPDHYHQRARYAQAREHGFWKAFSPENKVPFPETLRE